MPSGLRPRLREEALPFEGRSRKAYIDTDFTPQRTVSRCLGSGHRMRGYVALLLALFVAWPLLPAPAVGIQPGGMYGGTVTVAVLDDIDTNPLTASPADLEALGARGERVRVDVVEDGH